MINIKNHYLLIVKIIILINYMKSNGNIFFFITISIVITITLYSIIKIDRNLVGWDIYLSPKN